MPGGDNPGIVVTSPDPTENVRELVDAANLRSDDLRLAEARRVNESVEALRREATIRAEYDERLRKAESERINAIRAVDVAAVSVAAERQAQAANVLAQAVSTSAETLRSLVATTAAANAQALSTTTTQITERIAALEKSSYEGVGRTARDDPAMTALAASVAALTSRSKQDEGRGALSTPLMLTLAAVAGSVAIYALDHLH